MNAGDDDDDDDDELASDGGSVSLDGGDDDDDGSDIFEASDDDEDEDNSDPELDGDESEDEDDQPKAKKSKRSGGSLSDTDFNRKLKHTKDTSSLFAAVDDFSEMLQETGKSKTHGTLGDLFNKDKSSEKQLAWEQRRFKETGGGRGGGGRFAGKGKQFGGHKPGKGKKTAAGGKQRKRK